MDLNNFRPVIRMVLARYMESDAAESITSELLQSIEIAQALLGAASAPRNVSVETPRKRLSLISATSKQKTAATSDPFKGAILISSAPPVAGAEEIVDDTEDYWESKPGKGDGCNHLQNRLQAIMPKSITIKVPHMEEPVSLNCGIGSPGTLFVHVNYTVEGNPDVGVRHMVMLSQKPELLNKDVILEDIISQASAMFGNEKREIVSRRPPPQPEPDISRDMLAGRSQQDKNSPFASEAANKIAQSWSNTRDPKWR